MAQFISMNMQAGFPGLLTRGIYDCTIEAKANDATAPVSAYGVLVKFNATSDAVTPISAGTDAVLGFVVREASEVNNNGAIDNFNLVSVLKRGYIAVTAPSGETIVANTQVYLTSAGAITNVSTSNTALVGAKFMGPAKDGLVEIAYNI